jgi:uncharacterized SAM-binding protein YcdF (DUF218 family)
MVSKWIAFMISPLGTAMLLLVIAVLGTRRARRSAALLGLGWLWLWATPVVSGALAGWVEAQAGPRELAAVQPAPVIVVLGGAVGGARPPLRPEPDLGSAADRVWHAARLYHAGKAPRILLSGGSIKPGIQGEAHAMRRFLLDLGVPDAAIWLEAASTDTAGNAVLSAALLRASGVDEAILVTSALHMRRARAQFMQTGLTIHPAPTDFEVVDEPLDLQDFLPSARALDDAGRAMKEVVGWWAVATGVKP